MPNWKYLVQARIQMDKKTSEQTILKGISRDMKEIFKKDFNLVHLKKRGDIKLEITGEGTGKKGARMKLYTFLGRRKTALLAAALEHVKNIDSSAVEIKVQDIRDLRRLRRSRIVKRAADILRSPQIYPSPNIFELRKEVQQSAKHIKR